MTEASGPLAPRNRRTNKMDDQSNKQPNDPQPYQRSAWMYWLSTAAALALVLLVLMYVLRRYRGSRPYVPKDIGVTFDTLGRSVTRRSK